MKRNRNFVYVAQEYRNKVRIRGLSPITSNGTKLTC